MKAQHPDKTLACAAPDLYAALRDLLVSLGGEYLMAQERARLLLMRLDSAVMESARASDARFTPPAKGKTVGSATKERA